MNLIDPNNSPYRGNRQNMKLGVNSIEFDMLKAELMEMFGNLISSLQKADVDFDIQQDYNLVWVALRA